ncbi:MAG: hypothetical protein AAFQ68_27505 [Bacteroidota bacterium]
MSVYNHNLQSWWQSLSDQWQQVLIEALELEGQFSLTDLEFIFTIQELHAHRLTDLSPLYYLPQLEVLHLSHCATLDYRPLRALGALRELHLTYCYEPDIALMVGLRQLEVLDISYPCGPVQHKEDLIHLQQLREVYLNACEIDTLSLLLPLDHLEIACMYFNPIAPAEARSFQSLRSDCRLLC